MKKLLILVAILGLTTATMAQLPSYVPTNGLLGWWPFNGNANDLSGNGNNLNNNGASLTTDRLNISNKAFSFTGQSGNGVTGTYMTIPNLGVNQMSSFTINVWVFESNVLGDGEAYISFGDNYPGGAIEIFRDGYSLPSGAGILRFNYGSLTSNSISAGTGFQNQWIMCTMTKSNNELKAYINGNLIGTINNLGAVTISQTGNYLARHTWGAGATETSTRFNGKLDDFGIWNRALTQTEITGLYTAVSCPDTFTTQPVSVSGNKGANRSFSASMSGTGNSFQWQSNSAGLGWQNVPNTNPYTNANTNSLSVNGLAVSNHNQRFRVIASKTGCTDTSNEVSITISDIANDSINLITLKADTATKGNRIRQLELDLANKHDTLYVGSTITTDTLKISIRTGLSNASPVMNVLKVYPNPAATVLNIILDKPGYYIAKLSGITGQTLVTPTSGSIDISNLANGVYILTIYDTHENLVSTNKILITK